MTLGVSKPRNWGKDQQAAGLLMACLSRRVTYRLEPTPAGVRILVAPSIDGITIPYWETAAMIYHASRGRWDVLSDVDGRTIGRGISRTDAIRVAIEGLRP